MKKRTRRVRLIEKVNVKKQHWGKQGGGVLKMFQSIFQYQNLNVWTGN